MEQQNRSRQRIRATRSEEPQAMVARRAEALRPFLGATEPERLARLYRLLRSERRAASIGVGYDATRHAALSRLLAEATAKAGAKKQTASR